MIYIGLDLGKMRDYTAIAILDELPHNEWGVRYLERAPLGTPYLRVVQRVTELTNHPTLAGRCHLTMDASGVGNPVEEALRAARGGWRAMTAVTITGGDKARQASGYGGIGERWNVPRRDLLSNIQVLLEKGNLKISAEMPETRALVRELIRLRRSPKSPQNQSDPDNSAGGSSRQEHDDLVMAVALACWQATRPKIGLGMNRIL